MHYNEAVARLDRYLQKKPVHNVKDVLEFMRVLCEDFNWEDNMEDQNDFANICSNFDKHVKNNGLTSIGRKQFEKWWELMDDLGQLPEDPLTSFEDAKEQLREHFESADNSKEAHDIKAENHRLRMKLKELEAELKAANQKLESIRGIILWG